MRLLVTGANGMMGWGVQQIFDNFILTDKDSLDVTNIKHILSYKDSDFDAILHLAAMTDHHECERNPFLTYHVNTISARHIVELANDKNVPIIYIGTGGMFDGNKNKYTEQDTPNPLNHYSRAKRYGEEIVKASANKYYIIRCGWLFGGGRGLDKKFVGKILEFIDLGVDTISAINDVYGTPTYAQHFCDFIKTIIYSNAPSGIYHYTGERASRYEVAQEIIKNINKKIKLLSVSYNEYHDKFGLQTAYTKCEALDTLYNIKKNYDWKEGLQEYIRRCYNEHSLQTKSV